jgi:hypothetical protein
MPAAQLPADAMTHSHEHARVAILLSTFNGETFLREQLDSFLAQLHDNWVLYWRDDGSSDGTRAIVEEFASCAGQGRCVEVRADGGSPDTTERSGTTGRSGATERLGATGSFLLLLRSVAGGLGEADVIAFADQDDVWLPEKLTRGLTALAALPPQTPALYCARQMLVDAQLQPIGLSGPIARSPDFPAALTQNVATGCTVMLNRGAAALVARSQPSAGALHDWWCYLIVTAGGGRVVQDDHPVVLYRQHGRNLVGAPRSRTLRAVAALRRGPDVFMGVLRHNVAALAAQPNLLTAQARREVAVVHRALNGGLWRRLAALRLPGLVRQTWAETMLFRCWFLIG